MEEEIQNLKTTALAQITKTKNPASLQEIKTQFLGKKGKINQIIKRIPQLEPEKKAVVGRLINDVKQAIEEAIAEQEASITTSVWFDPTIPGVRPPLGHLHLVTQAIEQISAIFEKIGFIRVRYPEVEWDWFAFESLNMPKNHPARDEWETFFIDTPPHKKYGEMILTPHTSSGQVREMLRVGKPPIRMINIAKCYRRQSDVSHVPMFHQFEGLVIDKGISIVNLKGTLDWFVKNFFGKDAKTRLRPFHFQFTEPSFEVDITCGVCRGKGCRLCKSGWLELGGAGMVHPKVLKNGGIDPKIYTGFAFGWGVERTFMMKAKINIPDIRMLYSADLRILKQF